MSYERAREIFDHAETLQGEAREAYLTGECGEDSAMLARVRALLAARDRIGEFMEDAAPQWQGMQIGNFVVDDIIAEGGMGVVLSATQEHPHRAVAIKLIRGPAFSQAELHRFELEVQVLGRLDHPGIARIHEAGTTDRDGRPVPWFAMELVKGLPLTRYVVERGIGRDEIVRLLIEVCEAVHHAHLRGVIHRDLKPSNILVREDGQPKVLDFGVARVTDADVQLTTMHTNVGQILGTLPYMSPEQVTGKTQELDLRSDVYALGVLGFELLTGRLPQPIQGRELVDAVRVITSDDPDTLSGDGTRFPGDLETIIGKCLRKEPDRRYSSAAELADDLRRFLRDEPVSARPPSRRYLLQKFARRNRGVVAWSVLTIALVLGGLAVSLAGWSTAREERNRAVAAAQEANELSDVLVDLLSSPDPRNDGSDVKARDLLERASTRATDELTGQPEVAHRLHRALGLSYRGLGLDEEARHELILAVEQSRLLENGRSREADALLDLANLQFEFSEFDAADSLLHLVDEIESVHETGASIHARTELLRGQLAGSNREWETASRIYQAAYADAAVQLGPESRECLDLRSELGTSLWRAGEPQQARDVYEEVIAIQSRKLGPDHPALLKSVNNLGMIYRALEDYVRASELLRRAVATKIRTLGPDHPSTALGQHNLALVLRETGELDEALERHRAAVTAADQLFDPTDPRWTHIRAGYGGTLFVVGDYPGVYEQYSVSCEPLAQMYGDEHARMQAMFEEMATACEVLGHDAESQQWRARLTD